MQKKIPKGISDFKYIRSRDYEWVDKSLFIRDIIDSSPQVILLPRPRRFGKTLNLSMLRYFFENSLESHAHLFERTLIQQQGDTYWQEQGKYPVIFLSFKEVKGDNWQLCYSKIADLVADEVKRHLAFLSHDRLDPDDLKQLVAIRQGVAPEHLVNNALKLLSQVLSHYFEQPVIVLIDEYDVPIHNAYLKGFYNKAIDFMRTHLGAVLKDNTALHRGIITGALRIAKESIFTDLNNVSTYSVLNKKYASYFGFTEEETFLLLKKYHLESMHDEIRHWYNGYQFGQETIYNPWSILSFIDSGDKTCKPYWVNTSDNSIIKELITKQDGSFKADIEILLNHKSIKKSLSEHITLRDLTKNPDEVWCFLLFTGYLKCTSYHLDEANLDFVATLAIPNREVEYFFQLLVKWWLKQSLGNDTYSLFQNLINGDISAFTIQFQEYLTQSLSIFDLADKQPERIYHAFVLGLLVQLQSTHEVKSNRESGFGRYDVMLIPKDATQPGIIIEFKRTFAERGDTLESAADAALKQIEEKQYAQELKQRGIKDLLALGIAFLGKQVLIKEKKL